jgi:hypothetical protein
VHITIRDGILHVSNKVNIFSCIVINAIEQE